MVSAGRRDDFSETPPGIGGRPARRYIAATVLTQPSSRNSIMRFTSFAAASLAGVLGIALAGVQAADYQAGSLVIADPWLRATPKGASVAGGYMKISNNGAAADRLIGGSTDIAASFELHEMSMADGVAKMRPVQGGLEIKPGETVEFKPGSFHVMLMGLKKPLAAGEHIKATLVFEKAGKVDIDYDVRALGATGSKDAPKHGH
jgi:periplasmic copper chaperone A